jgi:hypothetical protein
MKNIQQNSRSVLECGNPLPLSKVHARTSAPQSAGGPAHSKTWRSLVTLIGFILLHSSFCLRVQGQSYTIDWYKIAGGGGTSTGGTYQVSGTIGQSDASGAMSGGNYSVTGGFWALVNVVQTPGAPILYISHNGNSVTVYWQDVSGWNLIQSGNLTTPVASWSTSSSPMLSNGTNSITLTSPTRSLFFRLKQ